MNNLNSVLVEGVVLSDAVCTVECGVSKASLTLVSNRYYKGEGDEGVTKEVSFFDVRVYGKLAEAVGARGTAGRGVRVVGRLRQERYNADDGKASAHIYIIAEHVEFRPDFKKSEPEAAETEASEDKAPKKKTSTRKKR